MKRIARSNGSLAREACSRLLARERMTLIVVSICRAAFRPLECGDDHNTDEAMSFRAWSSSGSMCSSKSCSLVQDRDSFIARLLTGTRNSEVLLQ